MIKIVFIKTTKTLLYTAKPGNVVRMTDHEEAKRLIEEGSAQEYTGEFPPKFENKESKTKIKLKDLQ